MAPTYLIRDNDGADGDVFKRRVYAMGIRDRPTCPRSTWQNGYFERVIGSIRRECLDHVIIRKEAHLRRVLRGYALYHNATRTHLGLRKDAPNLRSIERRGRIVATDILGGLHHQYGGFGFRKGQDSCDAKACDLKPGNAARHEISAGSRPRRLRLRCRTPLLSVRPARQHSELSSHQRPSDRRSRCPPNVVGRLLLHPRISRAPVPR